MVYIVMFCAGFLGLLFLAACTCGKKEDEMIEKQNEWMRKGLERANEDKSK